MKNLIFILEMPAMILYNLFKGLVLIKYLKYLIFGLMIKRTMVIQEC